MSTPSWEEKLKYQGDDKECIGCCGGDYCTGDHPGKLAAFIRHLLAEERKRVLDLIEGMIIGDDKGKMDKLKESLGHGWGCCGEEIEGYDVALSDLKARLTTPENNEGNI